MNLREIREYIANITDYDPNVNKDYSAQVDNVINETYRMLFSEKPFTFAQKEVKIPIYTDAEYTASGVTGVIAGLTKIIIQPSLPDWVEGNIIEIDGVEHHVIYKASAIEIYIEGSFPFIAQPVKFKQRYIRLPKDCV